MTEISTASGGTASGSTVSGSTVSGSIRSGNAEVAEMADSFVRVCSVDDLPGVGALKVEIDGEPVAIVRDSAGDVHAIDDTCSHANVSLSEGDVEDGEIECWLHGSRFDLRSGQPTGLPATGPIAVYPVKIDGDDVFVSVTKES